MKNIDNNSSGKLAYFSPTVNCIKLDNAISLQLESPNSGDSGDEVMNAPAKLKIDPFKTDLI